MHGENTASGGESTGGEHKNEVIETDESIDLLRLESDGAQRPSNLPSRKAYRDDY